MKIHIVEGMHNQCIISPKVLNAKSFEDYLQDRFLGINLVECTKEEVYPNGEDFSDNDSDDLPCYQANWVVIELDNKSRLFFKEDNYMNPYKFCNTKPDYTTLCIVKNKSPLDVLGTQKPELWDSIRKGNAGKLSTEYKKAEDMYYELTMSCNKDEAMTWMKTWMLWARAYWYDTLNADWMSKFLAAFDIYMHLKKN